MVLTLVENSYFLVRLYPIDLVLLNYYRQWLFCWCNIPKGFWFSTSSKQRSSFGIHGNLLRTIYDREQQVVLHILFHSSNKWCTTRISFVSYFYIVFANNIPSVVSSPVFMFAENIKIFCAIRSSDNYKALQMISLQFIIDHLAEIQYNEVQTFS